MADRRELLGPLGLRKERANLRQRTLDRARPGQPGTRTPRRLARPRREPLAISPSTMSSTARSPTPARPRGSTSTTNWPTTAKDGTTLYLNVLQAIVDLGQLGQRRGPGPGQLQHGVGQPGAADGHDPRDARHPLARDGTARSARSGGRSATGRIRWRRRRATMPSVIRAGPSRPRSR